MSDTAMLYRRYQKAAYNVARTGDGPYGKRPDTVELMNTLLVKLEELAEDRKPTPMLGRFVANSLSLTLANANLDNVRLSKAVSEAEHHLGRSWMRRKPRVADDLDPDVRSLKELVLFGAKGISAYVHHAAMLGKEDEEVYGFLFNALKAMGEQRTVTELTELVLECGRTAARTLAILDEANTGACGRPIATRRQGCIGNLSGVIVSGYDHSDSDVLDQVLPLKEKIISAVKSGVIKRFVVMAGCDGRYQTREYYTKIAMSLPKDAVMLTAGCSRYWYGKQEFGDINGIPRVLDAGQCNDSCSLVRVAMAIKEVFGLSDVNDLPLAFDIARYEQKAVAVLLALIALGFRNIQVGPTLPEFLSIGVGKVLIEKFGLFTIRDVENDNNGLKPGKVGAE